MAYKVKDLVFHLEIKPIVPPRRAALKLKYEGQELDEIVFNCGRTNGPIGSTDEIGVVALGQLLEALRKKLEELPPLPAE